jgi:TRAP-type uncharacterized transport system fused permease subunit
MKGVSAWIMGILYVAFVGWSLYGAVTPIETYIFRMIHLGFIFALAFPAYPMLKKSFPKGWIADIVLAALGVATIVWALTDVDQSTRFLFWHHSNHTARRTLSPGGWSDFHFGFGGFFSLLLVRSILSRTSRSQGI